VSVACELIDGPTGQAEGREPAITVVLVLQPCGIIARRCAARIRLGEFDQPPRIGPSTGSVAFQDGIPFREAEALGRSLAEPTVPVAYHRCVDGRYFAPKRTVSVAFCQPHERLTVG
jgi:hypothetical protein